MDERLKHQCSINADIESNENPISAHSISIPTLDKIVQVPEPEKQVHLSPYFYILGLNGKDFRKKLATELNFWYKIEKEDMDRLHRMIDILHNSSLIIDDIEDGSELRRGQQAAHLKYGVPLSINAANYMYFEALRIVLEFEDMKLVETFTKHLLSLHHGQGMEIYWRERSFNILEGQEKGPKIPTEEEYENIIVRKTSGQFLLMTDFLRMRSKARPNLDLTNLSYMTGVYFQMRDDFMNLTSEKYKESKGFCEDISEGKLSFPVIHALNGNKLELKEKQRLLDILEERTGEEGKKKEALGIIIKSRALDYTLNKLDKLKREIMDEIKRVGRNPKLDLLIKTLWI